MASLVLGSFNLIDPTGTARVMADGTSWGSPVPIEVTINSFLQDGAIVVTQGHDNREARVRVRFYGDDLTALAVKEAALFLELEKINTLTWTPDNGPATVFNVITSSLENEDADFLGDVQAKPWRTYVVRLVCEAFTQSTASFTSVGTAPGGATTTVLDACAATTGWTATVDGAAGTVTNAAGPPTTVAVSATLALGKSHTMKLQKTFAATTTVTNLLMVDWLPTPATKASLKATGDGVALPRYAEGPSPASGYTRTWFSVAAPSLAAVVLTMSSEIPGTGSVFRTFRVDNVSVTNVQPVAGTNRQQIRSLDVPGSARTQGSLAIESATAALGDTITFVYPSDVSTTGYSPPTRQFRTAGNTVTANSALVSGNSEPLNGGPVTFQVPIGLFPAGLYLLMARLATSGGGTPTITYTGKTFVGGNGIASFTASKTIATTTAYQNFALGRMQLPTLDLDPGAAVAGVTMSLDLQSTTACTYDEVWLFNTTIGQLTLVDCGTGAGTVGGTSRRLFIEPATVSTPRPSVRVGHSADRSDSRFPVGAITSWQAPEFNPPQVNVLTVTPNATDAVISLGGYARWYTNPAS